MKRQILKNLEIEFNNPKYTIEDKNLILEISSQIETAQKMKGKAVPYAYLFNNLQKGK